MDGVELTLEQRIALIQERIDAAARRARRRPAEITLVAVSKTRGPEDVVAAYAAGLRVFGENRVEEAAPKVEAVAAALEDRIDGRARVPLEWHMIGHIQSRKAGAVPPWASVVHSLDSEKLARRLDQASQHAGRELPVLLEVNVSGEASKYGFVPGELARAVETILDLPGLRIQGLMTMAPIAQDPETVRPVFVRLRELRDDLARQFPGVDWQHLSMGMTDDFEVAIEEGATMVRIGRAIFGERSCAVTTKA